jgi:hypothetical protein
MPDLPDNILESGRLAENGWFILEHGPRTNFGGHPNLADHRKYGNVNFSFFRRQAD